MKNTWDIRYIEDGNAIIHTLTDLPMTFKLIAFKVLDLLQNKSNVIFSTDMYLPDSVKSHERMRRGCSEKLMLEGVNTRKPADFKLFLQNSDNKVQLFKLMHRVWKNNEAANRLLGKSRTLIVEGKAYKLTSDGESVHEEELLQLESTHEETDSRQIIYLFYAKQQGYKYGVVHSPDSDIFFLTLYYAHKLKPLTVLLDTGSGEHRRLLNITDIAEDFGEEYCDTLLGYFVYTGEDTNCAFRGKGKVNPLKKLQKKPRYQSTFRKLGIDWEPSDLLKLELEEFTCEMYSHPKLKQVNKVRSIMLNKMVGSKTDKILAKSKVDLSRLPPCLRSLVPHIQRVNYRVAQWKRSHIEKPYLPPPTNHGWVKDGDILEPLWSDGPILPRSLIDIIAERPNNDETDNDTDGDDGDDGDEDDSSSEESESDDDD